MRYQLQTLFKRKLKNADDLSSGILSQGDKTGHNANNVKRRWSYNNKGTRIYLI